MYAQTQFYVFVCAMLRRIEVVCFEEQSVCRLHKAFYETILPFPSPALCVSKGNISGIVLNCAAFAISSNRA